MLGSRLTEFFKIFGLAALVLLISFSLSSCKSDTGASKGAAQEKSKLTFVADKPPPPRIAYQEVLMAAETSAEYFS